MDYNIYIHDKTLNQSKPTQPKKRGNNGSQTSAITFQIGKQGGNKTNTITSNGFAVNLKNITKIGKWGKVGIALAVAKAVLQTTSNIARKIESVGNFFAAETGDYRLSVAAGNFANVTSSMANPIGSFINDIKRKQNNYVINRKLDQQRLMLGDIYMNEQSGRKV